MSLVEHAKEELTISGYFDNDSDYDGEIGKAVLEIIQVFSDQGHSGMSASLVLTLIETLMDYKPLSPLTGEDSEWIEVADDPVTGPMYQNKRCSTVFKNNDGAYNIDGIVFWEWYTSPESDEKFKTYYTSYESRVPVTFPYKVPKHPTYKYKKSRSS